MIYLHADYECDCYDCTSCRTCHDLTYLLHDLAGSLLRGEGISPCLELLWCFLYRVYHKKNLTMCNIPRTTATVTAHPDMAFWSSYFVLYAIFIGVKNVGRLIASARHWTSCIRRFAFWAYRSPIIKGPLLMLLVFLLIGRFFFL